MSETRAPRILLCGDVVGRLQQLFKRVAAVNKANGPFDCLLCVGQFFPSSPPAPDAPLELQQYIAGERSVPLPTYFIGDYGEGALDALADAEGQFPPSKDLPGVEICPNLRWLKGAALVSIAGLQVAYLAGRFSPAAYHGEEGGEQPIGVQRRSDVERLVDQCADCTAVDLLLTNTNEWPQAVLQGADHSGLPPGINPRSVGSPIAAEIAKEVNPRYHVAGTEGAFFAREPYSNPQAPHVTRFIALAAVGNEAKQKFIHALSPTPASQMAPPDLAARPPNTTPSPYGPPPPPPGETRLWHGSAGGAGGAEGAAGVGGDAAKPKPAWASKIESEGQDGQYWRYSAAPNKRPRREGGRGGGGGGGGGAGGDGERICFEFASKGACSRGDGCRFRHTGEGGRPLPRNLCFEFFKKGECERGATCRFKHSLDPDEPSPADAAAGLPAGGAAGGGAGLLGEGGATRAAGGGGAGTRAAAPPAPCWFCLSSPEVEAHLVISVAEHCYVALCKGPLVPGHVLVLPIEHFPSSISMPADVLAEMARYKDALRRCFASQGQAVVMFERFLLLRAGTHAHLQVVPLPKEAAGGVRAGFESAAQKFGFDFEAIAPGLEASAMVDEVRRVSKGGNYLCVELPEGGALMHAVAPGERLPMQFGREVAAELLKMPERGDWKACKVSVEEETKIVEDFKALFLDFDIM